MKEPIVIHKKFGEATPTQNDYGLRILDSQTALHSKINGFHTTRLRKFEFYSISYLYDGAGRYWSPQTGEIALELPSFVITPPDYLHRYGGTNDKHYIEDMVRFYGPVADGLYKTHILQPFVYTTNISRKIPKISALTKAPSANSQLQANIELQKLIFEIYNEYQHINKSSSPIKVLLEKLNEDIGRWWQIKELIEITDMSPDTFRRKFKEETGMLPKHYIEELKIKHSAEILATTNRKISSIAKEIGYVDQYHFSRRFKAIMGTSPEKYRDSINRNEV